MIETKKREKLGSQLGFIMLSAGCAIGLGNVWRFPYITGKYGGAIFVLIYLAFLILLGLPVMVMEFAIGRASRKNIGEAYNVLEPKDTKWHNWGPIAIAGNYLLIMFYSTITGWLLYYFYSSFTGTLSTLQSTEIAPYFDNLTQNPLLMLFWMAAGTISCFAVVAVGLQKGVERVTKIMMSMLIVLMLVLAINSMILPNASKGLKFYLLPNIDNVKEAGIINVIFEAMGQAFFSLSVGMGGMAIFASYLSKEKSLTGESIKVIALDTFVAIVSGLIIFPACFAYNVEPGAGPSLLFISLPHIFRQMPLGGLVQTLFFLFMSFAALTTLIGVFENIIAYWMDKYGTSRQKACFYNALVLIVLSIPCILGFNVLSNFNPLGKGTIILDLEDFLVSRTIMPIGSLILILFTTRKRGWGFKNFKNESDSGKGLHFPSWARFYVTYILPLIIIIIFVTGYIQVFSNLF